MKSQGSSSPVISRMSQVVIKDMELELGDKKIVIGLI